MSSLELYLITRNNIIQLANDWIKELSPKGDKKWEKLQLDI